MKIINVPEMAYINLELKDNDFVPNLQRDQMIK